MKTGRENESDGEGMWEERKRDGVHGTKDTGKKNVKFWGELRAYFILTRQGPQRRRNNGIGGGGGSWIQACRKQSSLIGPLTTIKVDTGTGHQGDSIRIPYFSSK
jgi:hypothetical protein